MLPEFSLKGRVAVVTGGARGLGLEMMRALAEAGADVVALDVLEDQAQEAAAQTARDFGVRAGAHRMDVTDADETDRTVAAIEADFGAVDVLVAAAGVANLSPAEDLSLADWQRVIDINLTGTFLVTQAVLPLMKDRGWGRIVNFRSGSVFDGTPGHAHYVAAKAGVVGFSRSLAREVGDYGITVNVVTPGLTVAGCSSWPPPTAPSSPARP